MRKYCVLYLKNGREQRSPWFSSAARAARAFEVLNRRFRECIVYVD
jgi:hypothetical protein